jgi:outer membrane protein assembly factor BamB
MRARTVLGTAAAVVAAGLVAAVAVPVVRGSDAATTRLTTAGAPPIVPAGALAATVTARWSATSIPPGDAAASVGGSTVVVASGGRLGGHDPRTGAERWSYRRSGARLCGWTLEDGVVVAAIGKRHGCTELIALDAGTGVRRWYRNANLGGQAELTSASGVVVIRSGDQLLAVDTASGLNRWTTSKPGCHYGRVRVGTLGAIAPLRCSDGRTQIVAHDAYGDNELWRASAAGEDPTVLTADDPVTVLSRLGGAPLLTMYTRRGRVQGRVTDRRLAVRTGSTAPAGQAAGAVLLVWTGEAVTAVDTRARAVLWSARALGPPSVAGGRALLAEVGGLLERAVDTGHTLRRIRVTGTPLATGAALSRVGMLVIAAGPATVTAYR